MKPLTQNLADEIVRAARRWVGTPYHHQAAKRGVGVDCVGLITGVGLELGLMGENFVERFKEFRGYSGTPNPRKMLRGLNAFLQPAEPGASPGKIGWLQWRADLPMHLGIFAEHDGRATIIHAYNLAGECVEHTLDKTWTDRVNSFWKYPGT